MVKEYHPFGSKAWLDVNTGGGQLSAIPSRRIKRKLDDTDDIDMRALCRGNRCGMKCNMSCTLYRSKVKTLERLSNSDYVDDRFEYLRLVQRATERLLENAEGDRKTTLKEQLADIEAQFRKPR